MANFPTSIASQRTYSTTEYLSNMASVGHIALHQSHEGELAALGTKLGTGSSTASANTVLRGTGSGTSSWGQVVLTSDVSGVLPVANGGTGVSSLGSGVATFLGTPSSANLAAAVTNETGSGALVFGTSPTLTTPAIGDFTNAVHTHASSAQGGTLGASAITGVDKSITTTDSNPYKFSVYKAANQTGVSDSVLTKVQFDTEYFDTNNNFDTTNNRYVAPVDGFYQINLYIHVQSANNTGVAAIGSLYKNGVELTRGDAVVAGFSAAQLITCRVQELVQLTAGDYLEGYGYMDVGSSTVTFAGGGLGSKFSGFLVSRT